MVKASTKSSRKLQKKVQRVVEHIDDPALMEDAGGVPVAVVPNAIPSEPGLRTRRERLLTRAMKSAMKSSDTAAVKKKAKRQLKRKGGVIRALDGEDDWEEDDGEDDAEGNTNVAENSVVHDSVPAAAASSAMRKKGRLLVADRAKRGLLHAMSAGKTTAAGSSGDASEQIGPKIVCKTSLNLSSARRHELFVSEINQFNNVAAHAEFQADPLGAIQRHLEATTNRLRPQTESIGRSDSYQRRGAVLKQMLAGNHSGHGGRRHRNR